MINQTEIMIGNDIIYDIEVSNSNLYFCNNAETLVRGDIITTSHNNPTPVVFKNFASFTKCTTKTDGTATDDAEDLDLVKPMYNLIEHSSNCSDTTVSLQFYSNGEANNFCANITNTNAFNSFKYKAKLFENTLANENNSIPKNGTIVVPLKYLSDFWRSPKMSLINCKIALKFRWRKHCVLASTDIEKDDTNFNNIIFIPEDRKSYVPVVTLSLIKGN